MQKFKKILLLTPVLTIATASAVNKIAEIVYDSSLNFPLYKNERYYGGSKVAELASFLEGGRRVLIAQQKQIINEAPHLNYDAKRVFHAKSHGCFIGELKVNKIRPQDLKGETAQGLFDPSNGESYPVVVRFSNGVGIVQKDKLPDVRGVAIKVFDVLNSSTGQKQSVDLLMTNSPTPVGKDFLEFARFMDLVSTHGPTLGGILFSDHIRASTSLIKNVGLPLISNYKIKSMATQRYWSGHPYLLGPNKAMKFNLIPKQIGYLKTSDIKELYGKQFDYADGTNLLDNYLSAELHDRIASQDVKFTLALQLEKNPEQTPIEDNLVEWTEEITPSIPVAELVIYKQSSTLLGNNGESCEELRFTPAHYIPENRPLSNMGRGRLFGYEASQIGRGAVKEEPQSFYNFVKSALEDLRH